MAVQTQIQARRGTAATWTSTNPTLAAGETGYETDTGRFKIGTGSTAWASLGYFNRDPLTTKGDLYTFSTTDDRLAVGNNGESLVADSSTSTGLRYTGNYAAGKNKIINGDFNVWQRGTSFSNPANGTYCADRYKTINDGTGATRTISQQTFTAGTAPVAGYEGTYFMRYAITAVGTGNTYQGMNQYIEDVRTFAGQAVTVSFWAKADASRTVNVDLSQNFGSGGSSSVYVSLSAAGAAVTTSWQRFTFTGTVPSIAGKTIGTGSALVFGYYPPAATVCTVDIWGVQVEAGSVATAFQTATGTIQGELAACQRYYYRQAGGSPASPLAAGYADSTTRGVFPLRMPVTMRIEPNAIEFSSVGINFYGLGQIAVTSVTLDTTHAGPDCVLLIAAVASGLTQYRPYDIVTGSTGYIGLSAEL